MHLSMYMYMCSGTPLNGHPSTADTCKITDSEYPNCISINFNTFQPLNSGYPLIRIANTLLGPNSVTAHTNSPL